MNSNENSYPLKMVFSKIKKYKRFYLYAVSKDFMLIYKADYMKSVAPFLYPKKKEFH